MYAIVDIETTGLSPSNEKITEIAIYIHDGHKIVDEFSTLINPEKKIPYRIIHMTGINNQMVESAPKFYEVAKQIVEFTDGKIIVGHNVRFDYGFIRNEFKNLGYNYERKTLDTVKLSRKLIPGRKSYSLGKLCKDLEIENTARHRAAGDAMATTKLFELLLSIEGTPEDINLNGVQSGLNKSLVQDLPTSAGVYYFYDKDKELIYVGKSINIHDRVLSHLNNNLHKKAIEMKNRLADVDFQITGSELIALLLESDEIKKNQPRYNQSQKRTYFNYGLYSFEDDDGYQNLKILRLIDELSPLYTYSSLHEGKVHLTNLCEEFNLCQKLCGLYDTDGKCFHYQIHGCQGACVGEELPSEYNSRVRESLDNYQFKHQNFFVVDIGRNEDENSIVKIENGKYLGFGFLSKDQVSTDMSLMHDCIVNYRDNKEVRRIIVTYLKKSKCTVVEY
ncbi:MAG: GIY-YIG nuclease family protein [Bacteroidetes bacterium]|nr:GIY-YIG nuclease family protein [Bacteroidota bacterium]